MIASHYIDVLPACWPAPVCGMLSIDDTAAELLNRISGHNQAQKLARQLLPDVEPVEVVKALNQIHVETAGMLRRLREPTAPAG